MLKPAKFLPQGVAEAKTIWTVHKLMKNPSGSIKFDGLI